MTTDWLARNLGARTGGRRLQLLMPADGRDPAANSPSAYSRGSLLDIGQVADPDKSRSAHASIGNRFSQRPWNSSASDATTDHRL